MGLRQIGGVVLGSIQVASCLFGQMLAGAAHYFKRDFGLKRRYVLQDLLVDVIDEVFDATRMGGSNAPNVQRVIGGLAEVSTKEVPSCIK